MEPMSTKQFLETWIKKLKEKGFKGLLDFFNWPLDIMLSVFGKSIINLGEAVA